MCQEYTPEDDDFVEIEPEEWKNIQEDDVYQTFELWENLQNLDQKTLILLTKGFIDRVTSNLLENHLKKLIVSYRDDWHKELWKSKNIEGIKLNEFINGKVNAFEDCLYLIKKYKNI